MDICMLRFMSLLCVTEGRVRAAESADVCARRGWVRACVGKCVESGMHLFGVCVLHGVRFVVIHNVCVW